MGVCLGSNELIAVTDTNNHRILAFDETECVAAWGKQGKEIGQFKYPEGVCAVKGRLFVADQENDRIQVFSF